MLLHLFQNVETLDLEAPLFGFLELFILSPRPASLQHARNTLRVDLKLFLNVIGTRPLVGPVEVVENAAVELSAVDAHLLDFINDELQ